MTILQSIRLIITPFGFEIKHHLQVTDVIDELISSEPNTPDFRSSLAYTNLQDKLHKLFVMRSLLKRGATIFTILRMPKILVDFFVY